MHHYNTERPHQGIGDVAPARRFALAQPGPPEPVVERDPAGGRAPKTPASVLPPATRVVGRDGGIHLARHRYAVGRWLAGETVDIVCGDALVEIFHRGVLVVSHVARHQAGARIVNRQPVNALARRPRPRAGDTTAMVTRLVDGGGSVSFAGAAYKAGRAFARRCVEVGVIDGQVVIRADGETVRTHAIRHDRDKEHGALANPNGRPRKPTTAA